VLRRPGWARITVAVDRQRGHPQLRDGCAEFRILDHTFAVFVQGAVQREVDAAVGPQGALRLGDGGFAVDEVRRPREGAELVVDRLRGAAEGLQLLHALPLRIAQALPLALVILVAPPPLDARARDEHEGARPLRVGDGVGEGQARAPRVPGDDPAFVAPVPAQSVEVPDEAVDRERPCAAGTPAGALVVAADGDALLDERREVIETIPDTGPAVAEHEWRAASARRCPERGVARLYELDCHGPTARGRSSRSWRSLPCAPARPRLRAVDRRCRRRP